jgi:uncharacterized protein (TIGR03435 family)
MRAAGIRVFLLIVTVLARSLASAQPPADSPEAPPAKADLLSAPIKPIDFDIAVFRLNKSGDDDRTLGFTGDGFVAQNRPIHDFIRYAFAKGRGGAYRISGQPSWVDDDRYDIQARVAPEDMAEWRKLNGIGQKVALQEFLVQYLKLRFHPDPTPYPYYALVVAKTGVKMQHYAAGDNYLGPDGKPVNGKGLIWFNGNILIGHGCTTERLVDQLSGRSDRGIIDETGTMPTGFDFTLRFDPEPNPSGGPDIPYPAMQPGDVTVAVRGALKPLGLELKPTTGPMDGMVIDHIERPPEN